MGGYRVAWKKAPGSPDIAYPGRKIAIFVNGCFWHRCPHCAPSLPKRNSDFWRHKFARNEERDARKVRELEDAGWATIRRLEMPTQDCTRDYYRGGPQSVDLSGPRRFRTIAHFGDSGAGVVVRF